MVTFDPNGNFQDVLQRGSAAKTTLTAYFAANADQGALGSEARKYTYQEFPRYFVYRKNQRKWAIRTQGFAIGRMYFIKPTAGEVFYLRTLLTVVKGATSFEDLRRVPGHTQPLATYHAACVARGLLADDGEWRICLVEAAEMHTGSRLRHLFVTLLMFGEPSQPDALWNDFKHHICDDLEFRLRAMGIETPSEEQIYDYGLFLINRILQDNGHTLANWPSMPKPTGNWQILTVNQLIAEQLNYNRDEERVNWENRLACLNNGQREAYNTIMASINACDGKTFFLNGSGGTGKTFVYNTICAKLRSEGKIILCVSSSGISALLIRGGRTAHSMFKIPIDGLHEQSVCSIPKDSTRADLMRAADAIIWDEVAAQHRYAFEAVDRTLRDIRGDNRRFGGLSAIVGGDFFQTLPIVPKGSREDIVDATIQRSVIWQDIQILHLIENMRLDQADANTRQFAQWLLEVGRGQNLTPDSHVTLDNSMRVYNQDELIKSIYPAVDSDPVPEKEFFLSRMILAPRNADVAALNEEILDRMSGEARCYYSADEIISEAGADPANNDPIPVEYLRLVQLSYL
jgi:hypothetical protein